MGRTLTWLLTGLAACCRIGTMTAQQPPRGRPTQQQSSTQQSQEAQIAVKALPYCSTEKVNHSDCMFQIDRRYPVTFPTLQMAHGKKVHVVLTNPVPFETLTLDETSS